MTCRKGLRIQPLKSFAGWYLGTVTPEGEPYCRISNSYVKNEADAEFLDTNRQYCMENCHCNGGLGCFK